MRPQIAGFLFDKDGTLFDFSASWEQWAQNLIYEFAGAQEAKAQEIARLMQFDLAAARFHPNSIVIAGTIADHANAIAPAFPEMTVAEIATNIAEAASQAVLAPAVPLPPLLQRLQDQGLHLGVATNDGEEPARAHLAAAEILEFFPFIVGYDSGHGAKPDPGMCLAFADHLDIAPEHLVMVGDSLHDLHAGRAAGFQTLGVLTGTVDRDTLAPHADVVLRDIGEIPAWLEAGAKVGA